MRTISRLLLVNIVIALLTLLVVTVFNLSQFQQEAVQEEQRDLDRYLRTFHELLRNKGTEFRIVDDRLLVGEYQLSNNYELPDLIQKMFGCTATIFMGDTRVSTNVMKADGSRAVGTRLVGPAYDAVFRRGIPYRGEADILGTPYLTAYDPIIDQQGKTIGVLYVGAPKSSMVAKYATLRQRVILMALLLAGASALLVLLSSRELRLTARENDRHLAFLQTVIDAIPNPIFYKDEKRIYSGCNRAFENFLGLPRERIIGSSVHDIALPELAEAYQQADNRLLDQGVGREQVYESQVTYADGTRRDVVFTKATYSKSDGSLGGLVGTIHDITIRKNAEKALQQQKEFSEQIIERSAVPIFVIDSSHHVIFWNRACEVLTGFSADGLLATTDHWRPFYPSHHPCLADLIIDGHDETDIRQYAKFGASPLSPEILQAEGWYPNLNGTERYIRFHAAPIAAGSGELVAVIQTIEDITDLMRSEEAIRESLSLLNATIESTADGILVVDLNGQVVTHNRRFQEMWRIPDDLLPSVDYHHLLSYVNDQLKQPGEFLARVSEFISNPLTEGFDVLEFKDGRTFERLSQPQLIAKTVVGRVFSFRDVTGQKKLEAELLHARKMDAIGTLAGGVAHDFNNILTAILGFGNLIRERMEPDNPLQVYLKQILRAGAKAEVLTKSLLAYGRKEMLNPGPIELNELVRKMHRFLERIIGEDIQLSVVVSDEMLTLLGDSGQIEQVIMNLSVNARDAITGHGELLITTSTVELGGDFIKSHGYGKPGRYALLSIADTGDGMSAETMERIFEPFYTTKEPGKGTGLGLAIVFGIVKQHGGYITVDSRPGQGTLFQVYIPLVDLEPGRKVLSDEARPSGGDETILLVEDGPEVRQLLREVLQKAGYSVIEAVDGEDGLAKFSEYANEVQLLLTDVIMPKKNGRQLYEEMSELQQDIQAIFISGYSGELLGRKGIDDSGLNVLAKPFSPNRLLAKIREVLDA